MFGPSNSSSAVAGDYPPAFVERTLNINAPGLREAAVAGDYPHRPSLSGFERDRPRPGPRLSPGGYPPAFVERSGHAGPIRPYATCRRGLSSGLRWAVMMTWAAVRSPTDRRIKIGLPTLPRCASRSLFQPVCRASDSPP